ncbi:molybdenum cofactor guanylyltransferase [Micromonospora endolithica]|uniref:Bifunctional protein IspD/ispF n=1 Tax=Micromonospora endolithica TaxID=230091 RepID=A0A3A9ZDL2_9ACTN|nr:NTP transferase domain-containing protein [Micromonospora endolithica]RKN46279.1 bifunctional protein IspD/ispF [Micromonospora endolithica]TWJ24992.1 molybdopterin-guanine dinucleotide biosynthesis protein A [Micromonospora endolithica]
MGGYAAVVLAGGTARRMGGTDKPARPVAGRPMRDRVLDAVPDADPRILVGPPVRPCDRTTAGPDQPSAGSDQQSVGGSTDALAGVLVTREEPPGGGPVAALAAGLALLPATSTVVALLAADLPLLTRDAVGLLLHRLAGPDPTAGRDVGLNPTAGLNPTVGLDSAVGRDAGAYPVDAGVGDVDGVCFVDGDGRRQTLCGVWRVEPLRAALGRLAHSRGGTLAGAPLRAVVAGLAVVEVPWSGQGPPPWFDCDTDEDVRRAEEWAR